MVKTDQASWGFPRFLGVHHVHPPRRYETQRGAKAQTAVQSVMWLERDFSTNSRDSCDFWFLCQGAKKPVLPGDPHPTSKPFLPWQRGLGNPCSKHRHTSQATSHLEMHPLVHTLSVCFTTSLPQKKARSSIGADHVLGLMRLLLYPAPLLVTPTHCWSQVNMLPPPPEGKCHPRPHGVRRRGQQSTLAFVAKSLVCGSRLGSGDVARPGISSCPGTIAQGDTERSGSTAINGA